MYGDFVIGQFISIQKVLRANWNLLGKLRMKFTIANNMYPFGADSLRFFRV